MSTYFFENPYSCIKISPDIDFQWGVSVVCDRKRQRIKTDTVTDTENGLIF